MCSDVPANVLKTVSLELLQCTDIDVLKDLRDMHIKGFGKDRIKMPIEQIEQCKVCPAENTIARWADKINQKMASFGIQVSWAEFLNSGNSMGSHDDPQLR
jgi:hypothetical protein